MKLCAKCNKPLKDDNTRKLCFKCHLSPTPQWSSEAKELIEWGYWYIENLTITKNIPFYVNLKRDIEEGPASKMASSGELIAKLKKMKQLVDKELSHNNLYSNFKGQL